MKLVIDISHWEDVEDWDAIKAMELDGVYLKATQGTGITDAKFNKFRKGFKEIGVPWGAYHFYDHRVPGLSQSKHFIDVLGGDWGELPPCFDFEPLYILKEGEMAPPRAGCISAMLLFLNDVEIKTGIKPIIYTNPDHLNFLKPIPEWLLKYDLWIASYTKNPPSVSPWKDWIMWQFTEAGHIDGIDGAVDCNHAKDSLFHVTQPEKTDKEKLDLLWKEHPDLHE